MTSFMEFLPQKELIHNKTDILLCLASDSTFEEPITYLRGDRSRKKKRNGRKRNEKIERVKAKQLAEQEKTLK